jgi:hypothetical protein
MPEIVYECSVKSGHPKKIFSQDPKYPVYCCGKHMVKVRGEKDRETVKGPVQRADKPRPSAPDTKHK